MYPSAQTLYSFDSFILTSLHLKDTRGLEPFGYRGELLSTLLHAIVKVLTHFVKCTSIDCKLLLVGEVSAEILRIEDATWST
jgi:hypothetical protein